MLHSTKQHVFWTHQWWWRIISCVLFLVFYWKDNVIINQYLQVDYMKFHFRFYLFKIFGNGYHSFLCWRGFLRVAYYTQISIYVSTRTITYKFIFQYHSTLITLCIWKLPHANIYAKKDKSYNGWNIVKITSKMQILVWID